MKPRKFVLSLLGLLILVLSACTPAAASSRTAAGAIPASLLNADYNLLNADPPNTLRFRAHDDPICVALNAKGNCFTILVPTKADDPGVRGSAAFINGQLVLKMEAAPYAPDEIGLTDYFEVKDNNGTLVGIKCETSSNGICGDDVGSTWKRAG